MQKFKTLNIVFKLLFSILAIIVLFLTCYLFGWEILEASLKGNEFAFVMAMSEWVDRHLFQTVQWYPFHGGGMAVTQATQIGVYYAISLLHRLTGLSIAQATRLTAFLSIFLVCVEIYLLVWWKLKSQVMALLASFFFPLSHAAWNQITYLGILAQPFSVLFILPTIFLFDLFLRKRKTKVFVLTVFSFGLSLFAHILTTQLIVGILLIWAFCFPFLFSTQGKWSSLKFSFTSWLKVVVLGSFLVSFWLFPFLRYVGIASRNLVPFQALEQISYITFPFLLGFGDAWGGRSDMAVFFALPVLVFALLGIFLAIFRKDKLVLVLSFFSVGFLLYSGLPFVAPRFVKFFLMNLVSQTYARAFVIPLVLLPILASYGVFQASKLPFFFLKGPVKKFLVGFLTVFLAALGLIFFQHVPPIPSLTAPCYFGFGPWFATENDYCHPWAKLKDIKLAFGEDTLPFEPEIKYILEKTGVGAKDRFEISPTKGGLVMAWPLYSQASTINLQLNTAGLNNIFRGYQVAAFYGEHEFGTPEEVANLASWFGIEHLVLSGQDPLEKYESKYWQDVARSGDLIIKKFKGPAGLVTFSSKPKILFLGKFANRAYEQFFRLAAAGAYPYGKAIFVEGNDDGRIDGYSFDELKQFDLVFLYGYSYKNWEKNEQEKASHREKAFKLLADYVKEGGRLFIETGWQYASSEWEWETPAEIIPVKKLSWQEFRTWDLEGFSPPSYKGGPWGVSAGGGLKDWAQPVLTSGGKVLIAKGDYGRGKIIWSGMNLIGHAFTYRNKEEFAFFESLIDWLIGGLEGEDKTSQVDFERINPDKIEFTFLSPQENSWLYFRENFHPDWFAQRLAPSPSTPLRTSGKRLEKLPIYRAGPNFMFIPLERVDEGEKLVLELKDSPSFIFSRILSVFILIFLLILFFKENWLGKIKDKIKTLIGYTLLSKPRGWWDREEEV